MEERKIYQEIPGGKNNFHSAVLTSFSFDFHHFENQVLRVLKQKWITSINVLVDQRMLDDVLGLSTGNLKTISQAYSVNGIQSIGAFHPKINFLIGDKQLLLIFGSGNITVGGHGKNHEIFAGFYADDEDNVQLPLILETWNYLQNSILQIEGYAYDRIANVLPHTCTLIKNFEATKHQFYQIDDNLEVSLLYNDENSIYSQLSSQINVSRINKITIVSPYYDKDGSTLIDLLNSFPNAELDVYLQKDFGLPPVDISPNHRISFYNWDNTDRGENIINGKKKYYRKLHSKIFIFKESEIEYCLIGSANATRFGLGNTNSNPINDEFGALYKSSNIDFSKKLGITGEKIRIENVNKLERKDSIKGDSPTVQKKISCRIKSIDLSGNTLKIYIEKHQKTLECQLIIFDIYGDECFRIQVEIYESIIELNISDNQLVLNPKFCLLSDNNGIVISNKQLINFLYKLDNTNPSSNNRKVYQLINKIGAGQLNEFEIVEYLNELNDGYINSPKNNVKFGAGRSKKGENPEDFSGHTYEEAILAAKNNSNLAKIINSNSTSRILASISHLFDSKSLTIIQELMDEEEEGDASSGRDRKNDKSKQDTKFKIKNYNDVKLKSVEKMVTNYIKSVKSIRTQSDHLLDILDFHNFLLMSYLFTTIYCFTEYELPKDINISDWQKKMYEKYRKLMLEALVQFCLLCKDKKIKSHDDDTDLTTRQQNAIQKVISNVMLNLHLIDKKNSEPVIKDQINLIGLNILFYCGLTDELFEEYIKNVSLNYQDQYFNPVNVFRLKDKILECCNEINPKYLFNPSHGFCKVIDVYEGNVQFKSLHATNKISLKKLKIQNM
jgi:hypothetical protein